MNMAKYFIPPMEVGRGPTMSEWIRSSSPGVGVFETDGSGSQWAFPCVQASQNSCVPVSD